MAAIVGGCLTWRDGLITGDPFDMEGVRTYNISSDVGWTNGTLRLPFVGSRIEAVLGQGNDGQVTAELDGRPPSTNPSTWAYSRTSLFMLPGGLPSILRIIPGTNWVDEHWTATVLSVTTNLPDWSFTFKLHGSKTGDDGVGTNTVYFKSDSGRVSIDPFRLVFA